MGLGFFNPITSGGGGDLADIGGDATAGSVIFADGSGLAEDNSNFFWDNTDKRLGIGTASPAAHLEVTPDGVKSDETPEEIFQVTERAHTSLSDAEYTAVLFDLSATVEFDGGANFSDQRAFRISAPTYAAEAAHTITRAATLYIDRAPQAGSNVTLSNAYALWVDAGISRFDGAIHAAAGSESAPGLAFQVDPSTGFYVTGGGNFLKAAVNGNEIWQAISGGVFQWDNNNVTDVNPSTARGITFGADARWAAGFFTEIDIEAGGTNDGVTATPPILNVEWSDGIINQNAEFHDVHFDLDAHEGAVNHEFNSSVTNQRAFRIDAPTYDAGSAVTITHAATVYIQDSPGSTGSMTITNSYALWVDDGNIRQDGDTILSDGSTVAPGAKLHVINDADSSGTPGEALQVVEAAHTSLADSEATAVLFDLSATVEFDGGSNFTNQRAFRISAPTYAAEAAHTITNAATLYIDAAPTAGTNVTLTNSYALWVNAGETRLDGAMTLNSDLTMTGNFKLDSSGNADLQVDRGTVNDFAWLAIRTAGGATGKFGSPADGTGDLIVQRSGSEKLRFTGTQLQTNLDFNLGGTDSIIGANNVEIDGDLNHDGSNIGFFDTAPTSQQTITGARDNNAALADLLTSLANYGLIVDSTTAT